MDALFELLFPLRTRAVTKHKVFFKFKAATNPYANTTSYDVRPPRTPIHVPIELVLYILELAYLDETLEADDALLRACALVCRSWRAPAQELLFRHVKLRSQRAVTAFKAAAEASSGEEKPLSDHVAKLRVIIDPNHSDGISYRSFASALALCPNLRVLDLSLYGHGAPGADILGDPDVDRLQRSASLFDEDTLALLRTGPRISSLKFTNWSHNRHILPQLLSVWPTVQSISMGGTPPKLAPDTRMPLECGIQELHVNFQTSPSLDFVKWLLGNSGESLRSFSVERDFPPDHLHYVLGAHHSTLQTLSLPYCYHRDTALAVHKCSELKALRIEGTPCTSAIPFNGLLPSVEHIAFTLGEHTGLQTVIGAVRSSDKLKTVTTCVVDNGNYHAQLSVLKVVCAVHGVRLRILPSLRAFRSLNLSHCSSIE